MKEELTRDQSLKIIESMIGTARKNIVDNGFSWLIWGTLIFFASLATYFLIETGSDNVFMAWNAFGIFAVVMLLFGIFRPKKKQVKTYVDDLLRYINIGFAVCIFVTIFSINISVGPNNGFGYFLMLYAFLMLIQGGAMKFKPLIFGAIINWMGAMAIFYNTELKYDMLITAAAVFIGYLIPGFILARENYKQKKSKEIISRL
jgi:membrane-associated HD superfamily phosphohydrolase